MRALRTYAGPMTATPTVHRGDLATPQPDVIGDAVTSNSSLRRFLHGLPAVDQVGAEARAAALGTRSIKTTAKAYALDLAIRMVDLTTLEGADTPGKVRALSAKAVRPDPADPTCPSAAAVCVYSDLVATAKRALEGTDVHVDFVCMHLRHCSSSSAECARGARGMTILRR